MRETRDLFFSQARDGEALTRPAASKIEQAAIDYLRRSWSVIPLRPRTKLPIIPWEEYQSRRATEAEIAAWFRRWPQANIGIVTGAISGLAVLDIDPRHSGEDSLRQLEGANAELPITVEAETGGGGHHFYFALPGPHLRNRAALAPGIDLRAKGGMVVAPPSRHPSGRHYRWLQGRDPASVAPAALPEWLMRLALGSDEPHGHSVAYWRDLLRAGAKEGVRNTTIASLAGHLLWHGVDPEVVTELLLCWNRVRCNPPLADDEVLRVAHNIIKLHLRDAAQQ